MNEHARGAVRVEQGPNGSAVTWRGALSPIPAAPSSSGKSPTTRRTTSRWRTWWRTLSPSKRLSTRPAAAQRGSSTYGWTAPQRRAPPSGTRTPHSRSCGTWSGSTGPRWTSGSRRTSRSTRIRETRISGWTSWRVPGGSAWKGRGHGRRLDPAAHPVRDWPAASLLPAAPGRPHGTARPVATQSHCPYKERLPTGRWTLATACTLTWCGSPDPAAGKPEGRGPRLLLQREGRPLHRRRPAGPPPHPIQLSRSAQRPGNIVEESLRNGPEARRSPPRHPGW